MAFGKPGSFLAAIIFAVGFTTGIIALAVSAARWNNFSSAGHGLGITGGVLGAMVFAAMIFWMVFTLLNEWDPAWLIFLIVAALSCLFAFIAGILWAVASEGVPAAFNFIHFVVAGVGIFFWIRSKVRCPPRSCSN